MGSLNGYFGNAEKFIRRSNKRYKKIRRVDALTFYKEKAAEREEVPSESDKKD